MTTHDAPTKPATYLTITTEQLLRLDAAHPGARWWLKADAHGSWSGPVVNPLDMMKDVEDLDGHLREQILNNLDGARIGLFNEDVMLLMHRDQLIRAGVDAETADAAGRHLLDQVFGALELAGQSEGVLFGFRPVFPVTDDGEILMTPLSAQPGEVGA